MGRVTRGERISLHDAWNVRWRASWTYPDDLAGGLLVVSVGTMGQGKSLRWWVHVRDGKFLNETRLYRSRPQVWAVARQWLAQRPHTGWGAMETPESRRRPPAQEEPDY